MGLFLEALALGPNQETRATADSECPHSACSATEDVAKATAGFLLRRLGLSEQAFGIKAISNPEADCSMPLEVGGVRGKKEGEWEKEKGRE